MSSNAISVRPDSNHVTLSQATREERNLTAEWYMQHQREAIATLHEDLLKSSGRGTKTVFASDGQGWPYEGVLRVCRLLCTCFAPQSL